MVEDLRLPIMSFQQVPLAHKKHVLLKDNPDSFDLVEWGLFDAHTEAEYEAEVDKIYE